MKEKIHEWMNDIMIFGIYLFAESKKNGENTALRKEYVAMSEHFTKWNT